MLKNIDKIVDRIKKETNNDSKIIYRTKFVNHSKVVIVYNEYLTDSDNISDFIIRSINKIERKYKNKVDLLTTFKNDISMNKIKEVDKYNDLMLYLNSGFTIILIEDCEVALVFETKKNLFRSVDKPTLENSIRASMDSFNESIETNIGLVKRRIKSPDMWVKEYKIGKYTNTNVSLVYVNSIVKKDIVDYVDKLLNKINIDGIVNIGEIKNLIEKETKSIFPTIILTERPDNVASALLKGKIAIFVDNSPFALIIPAVLNDYFILSEDTFGKNINTSFTRVIRYMAFFISLLTPAIYIALITYNFEILPTVLIANLASQREIVPFPAYFEAIIMIVAFEILRESDLKIPNFASSALSIVGALILGEAAVNAGLISPIMIIVISITAISALSFSEPEIINALRWYRLVFMLGACFMGIIGVVIVFLFLLIKLSSLESFGKPYLMPYVPINKEGLKNSIIKFPFKKVKKRESYLSNNIVKMGDYHD